MEHRRARRLVFQPRTARAMQRGINQIVDAIRPTLGPRPRLVAIEDVSGKSTAEFLDCGGVIARRIIELADRDADVGAMLIRQALWQLYETCGDGTATAAIIFQSIFNQSVRYIAAGGNAMVLGQYLEKGMHIILDCLAAMACPVQSEEQIKYIAGTVCYDPEIATIVGEIFDTMGEEARVEVRHGYGHGVDRQYVEGMYWNSTLLTAQGQGALQITVAIDEAAILLSDFEISEIDDLLPVLTAIIQSGTRKLVIVARSLSDKVQGFLISNSRLDKFQAVVVSTPGADIYQQVNALEDLSLLTGARPLIAAAGDTLSSFRVQNLGYISGFWAQKDAFGFVSGRGSSGALDEHLDRLRASEAECADAQQRRTLQDRIGNLINGSVLLWVGGITETEIETRKTLAERTVNAVRLALSSGVVPGGGAALVACQTPLKHLFATSVNEDERTVYRILMRALEEPCRTIATNAGYDPGEVMAQIELAEAGYALDVRNGAIVSMAHAGILDSADVMRNAVHTALATAELALSVDVIYHHRRRLESSEP